MFCFVWCFRISFTLRLDLDHNYQMSITDLNASQATDRESQKVLMFWNTITSLHVTSQPINVCMFHHNVNNSFSENKCYTFCFGIHSLKTDENKNCWQYLPYTNWYKAWGRYTFSMWEFKLHCECWCYKFCGQCIEWKSIIFYWTRAMVNIITSRKHNCN